MITVFLRRLSIAIERELRGEYVFPNSFPLEKRSPKTNDPSPREPTYDFMESLNHPPVRWMRIARLAKKGTGF